ncbi:MAG: hypothetical protein ACN6RH_10065, partial [Stenotrophomonas rhizophila]|uniref:hypothetical protein n=1 Tax=Stenotrophomonas rhizophila TaxID=216778 RepID=UPI003D0EACC1
LVGCLAIAEGQPTNGRLYQTPCAAIRIRNGGVPTNVADDGNPGASRCSRADRWSAAVQSPQEQPTYGRLYRDIARRDPHTEHP